MSINFFDSEYPLIQALNTARLRWVLGEGRSEAENACGEKLFEVVKFFEAEYVREGEIGSGAECSRENHLPEYAEERVEVDIWVDQIFR